MAQKHHRQIDSVQQPRIKRQDFGTNEMDQFEIETSETWAILGKCSLTFGHLDVAYNCCRTALEKNPSNPIALCTIAKTYREDDLMKKSNQSVTHALMLLDDSIRNDQRLANDFMVLKELGECQMAGGFYDQAHNTFERLLRLNDNDASIWHLNGKTLIRMNSNPNSVMKNSAINCFKNAISRSMYKSRPMQSQSQPQADANLLRSCYAELAAIALSERNLESASLELSNTLQLPLPNEQQRFDLSCTWCALILNKESNQDINGALIEAENAEKVLSLDPRFMITKAYLLLVEGSFDSSFKAIFILQSVIQQQSHQQQKQLPNKEGDFLPYYLLGTAYANIDDPASAYDAFHVALSRAPSSPFPWLSVGALYLKLNQLRDSLEAYSKAAKLKDEIVDCATAVVTWKGLACVYERCDKQYLDAANACKRAAAYSRIAGDFRAMNQLEQRSHALLAASRGDAPVPKLQDPPEPPLQLLREMINLSSDERIELINRQNIQQEQHIMNQPGMHQQQQHVASGPPVAPQQVGPPPPGPPQGVPPPVPGHALPPPIPGPPGPPQSHFQGPPQYNLAPINRESTPLSRPNITLPSPQQQQQQYYSKPQVPFYPA